ncbi:MAG: hypothetical protein U1F43_33870 [Myxococcota bacterium]
MNHQPIVPLDVARQATLERFLDFYDELDQAIEEVEVDRIADLVAARQPIVDALVAAWRGEHLPEPLRQRIVASEAQLRAALVRLHDILFRSLSTQRRVAYAVGRYGEAP